MSELNLLLFGCAVSFIVVGGAYIYIRESFVGQEEDSGFEAGRDEVTEVKHRGAA